MVIAVLFRAGDGDALIAEQPRASYTEAKQDSWMNGRMNS